MPHDRLAIATTEDFRGAAIGVFETRLKPLVGPQF